MSPVKYTMSHTRTAAIGDTGRRRWRVAIAAFCAGVAAAPAVAQDSAKKTADKGASVRPALTVNVARPQTVELAGQLAANGAIVPWQEAILGAEIAGLRITQVRADTGDSVRRGQVLAVLQSEAIEADIAQARAAIAEAEATLADASANAARARAIQGAGALSEQQIAQQLTAEKTAEARLAAQRAAMNQHQLRLKYTRITASDDGVISARNATLGAVAGQGQELFRLIRQSRLEWRAEVTAAELSQVRAGQAVQVRLRASGAPAPTAAGVSGRVRMISPTVDMQTRNAMVYVELPKAFAAGLRPGMYASGEFLLGTKPALTVPQAAVVLRDGFHYVFTLESGSRVKLTKVQLGRRDGAQFEVTAGLAAMQTVVVSGAAFLSDGDSVRVVSGGPAK
jgi:RND family efflux transporter MFP subunit